VDALQRGTTRQGRKLTPVPTAPPLPRPAPGVAAV
jgi:hypothetical protein